MNNIDEVKENALAISTLFMTDKDYRNWIFKCVKEELVFCLKFLAIIAMFIGALCLIGCNDATSSNNSEEQCKKEYLDSLCNYNGYYEKCYNLICNDIEYKYY